MWALGPGRDANLRPLPAPRSTSFCRFPCPLERILQGVSPDGPAQKRQDPRGESRQGWRGWEPRKDPEGDSSYVSEFFSFVLKRQQKTKTLIAHTSSDSSPFFSTPSQPSFLLELSTTLPSIYSSTPTVLVPGSSLLLLAITLVKVTTDLQGAKSSSPFSVPVWIHTFYTVCPHTLPSWLHIPSFLAAAFQLP